MIEIEKETNLFKALARSVLGVSIVVILAFPLSWLTFFIVFGFSYKGSTAAVEDKMDIFLVLFIIGLILEIPYRIYTVLRARRHNSKES
jgi:hypothetical protein